MLLRGLVVDQDTGQSLVGVKVECIGVDRCLKVFSDQSGKFQVTDIDQGNWTVIIAKPPYAETRFQIPVKEHEEFIIRCLQLPGLDDDTVTA